MTSGTSVDGAAYREAMARLAGAVHLVTTDGPAGQAGFTATAVTPVTDDPPSLLVCVNTLGRSAKALLANGVFGVSTLASDDRALAEIFAGRSGQDEDRFARGAWERGGSGSPLLASALVSFDCRISDARVVATHHVIIGEITGIRLGEPRRPLIYQGRLYHGL
ncbi:MAG: flavin reductase family protein [Microvirga sp.]